MCILCVFQEVSRKANAMLPWLLVPLFTLWAFTQILPPSFRIDTTTTRVACYLFLAAFVLWQRVLRPQLFLWQARRSAQIRERRWIEAVELQKQRKIAVRRCRNCLTPYRDQNPGAGKFMCVYCGHISKRPVLDIPGMTNERDGWWFWRGRGVDERCLNTGKSYSGAVVVTRRLVYGFFYRVRWVMGKLFGVGSLRQDGLSDEELKGLSKKGKDGGSYQESKGDKARRKADEKRQARMEREMLEEEERKQREDVARLIEEQRKLRDEKVEEVENDHSKSMGFEKGRDGRRDSEKKRLQDRRKDKDKDKDKSSSKSNSDGDNEKKRESDKKSDAEKWEFQKACIESIRNQMSDGTVNTKTNVNSKPRYFDRVAGSFLSSSRGFGGANFFGKGAPTPTVSVSKPIKPTAMPVASAPNRRDGYTSGNITATNTSNGEDKLSSQNPVSCNQPPTNVWKKSWQQLFTCSSAVYPYPDAIFTADTKQSVQSTQMNEYAHPASSGFPPLNQVNLSRPLSLPVDPVTNDTLGSRKNSSVASGGSLHPIGGDKLHDSVLEEQELFEDPCYIPDPVTLLGPVSKSLHSLDNFPMNLGSGFVADAKRESSPLLRSVSASTDVKPSPIEAPMSRLRLSREKPSPIGQAAGSPRARDSQSSLHDDSIHSNDQGSWQMWDTPMGLDSLGIVGGSASRLLPTGPNKLYQDDSMHPLAQNNMPSYISKDSHAYSGTSNLNNYSGSYHKDDTFIPPGTGFKENIPWLQKNIFQELPSGDTGKKLPHEIDEIAYDNPNRSMIGLPYDNPNRSVIGHPYDNPNRSVLGHPYEQFSSDRWPKPEWIAPGVEEVGNTILSRPPTGGLFPADSDVQSFWSYK